NTWRARFRCHPQFCKLPSFPAPRLNLKLDQTNATFIQPYCNSFAIANPPVDDGYSSIGPTLQLAAETVGSRLRRPTTCSRTASLFACAVSCALTSTRSPQDRCCRAVV